jgi:hypothetical protein
MGFDNPGADDVYDYGLFLLNQTLQQSGHSLQDFAMPVPCLRWDLHAENEIIAEQLNYNYDRE